MALACVKPTRLVPQPLTRPVVRPVRTSARMFVGMAPGSPRQVAVGPVTATPAMFGLALFAAEIAPIGEGPVARPLLVVPDVGAMMPREMMSYRLIACTS